MDYAWYEQSELEMRPQVNWLNEWEWTHVSRLRIPKRKTDWLLGRWTAKKAVAAYLGLSDSPSDLARIEVWPAASGAPRLFLDGSASALGISLSHSHGRAVCVVGPSQAVGCDIEAIETRVEPFVADYFSEDERAAVNDAAASDREQLITLFWSAKESALKALGIGLRTDTRLLTVTLHNEAGSTQGKLPLVALTSPGCFPCRPLSVRDCSGNTFTGLWCSDHKVVRTLVTHQSLS